MKHLLACLMAFIGGMLNFKAVFRAPINAMMGTNTILTTDKILLKALDVLHAKLNFIGSINRNYDSQFAQTGGKIGESLRIRLPEKFTVTDGAILDLQDSVEQSITMTQATRKHVGMHFTSQDLTMSLDDFTERKIEPAMAALASTIEADALSMVLDIYNTTGTFGVVPASLVPFLGAKAKLNQYLAPKDHLRNMLIDSTTTAAMVEGLKSIFNDQSSIAAQYKEGQMGRTAGFMFAENDLLPVLTNGTRTGSITVNGAAPTGATIALKALGASTTIKKGEVFTIAGYYAVHPETKTPYSHLQQFVVTADATGGDGGGANTTIAALPISPAIVTSGAYQNVYGAPGADAVVIFQGGAACGGVAAAAGASTAYGQNIAYHKNAFAFVSADLELPRDVKLASRHVKDGISMRMVGQYDINNDRSITRLDVLYGFKTIRPELACRVTK